MNPIIQNGKLNYNEMSLLEATEEETIRLTVLRKRISKTYEVVMEICRQANVPEAARNLIDALIRLSNSELQFSASDYEVAKVFFENEPMRAALRKRVQRWRKKLDAWQTEAGVTLVQIKSGHQTHKISNDGKLKPENIPCQYRLRILDLAAKVLSQTDVPTKNAVLKILGELPPLPSRLDERRNRPITSERCRKQSLSWLRKTLNTAKEEGFLKQVVTEVKDDFLNMLSEYEAEGGTNSSHFENVGGANDYTINTISTSYSFSDNESNKQIPVVNNNQFLNSTSEELSMMNRAIELARRGFRVFPVYEAVDGICSCSSGAACEAKAKHPRIMAWHIEATTDEVKIKDWWRKWRRANIGIATGEYGNRNIVVLDIDPKHGGFESLELLENGNAKLPDTLTSKTGSDGRHKIFCAPLGLKVGNIQASEKLGKGLDVRGNGGFIVAAGSLHILGKRYEWAEESAPITDLPEWLIEKLTAQPDEKLRAVESTAARREKTLVPFKNLNGSTENEIVSEGGRNNFLFNKAIGLFHNGYEKAEVGSSPDGIWNRALRPSN